MRRLKGLNLNMALLYSTYRWCIDNAQTPCLLFKPEPGAELVISLSQAAIRNMVLYDDSIRFKASFSGQIRQFRVLFSSIISFYSLETGEGVLFTNGVLFGTNIRRVCDLKRLGVKISFDT